MDRSAKFDVDRALLERFEAALGRHSVSFPLGLAVSGGADSMALLLLAHKVGAVAIATVDHGLRPEAADECALVARTCERLGVPCTILTVSPARGNVQEEARRARYDALEAWALERGIRAIATAHHADDQAETLLMRLNRGSGLAGLTAVRPARPLGNGQVSLVRPLLDFRQSELQAVVEAACVEYVEDPSNDDERFERVRIRRALGQADWIHADQWARSVAHLADAAAALDLIALTHWDKQADREGGNIRFPVTDWGEINGRLVHRAIRELGGDVEVGEVIAFLNKLADTAEKGNLAGIMVRREGSHYVCEPEPPRRTG